MQGTGSAGSSASGTRRRPTCLCRPVDPPASGARPPLTLQDDLLERLALQPVPAPQFLRDVALPAGEIGRAETRRHGARGPGASALPIRAGTGGRGPQHEATRGRGKAGSPTLTSTSRPPPAPSGMVCMSMINPGSFKMCQGFLSPLPSWLSVHITQAASSQLFSTCPEREKVQRSL